MRFEDRMHSLRQYSDTKKCTNLLGMKYATNEEAHQLPFVNLAGDLDSERDRVPTSFGEPVLQAFLDSSLSCTAVPDHMITGLTKDVSFRFLL